MVEGFAVGVAGDPAGELEGGFGPVVMVIVPVGVAIVAPCTMQKNGTTVPPIAPVGIVKLLVPVVNSPVSKAIPFTLPGVKAPGACSLVTE